jgi:hypothetical protein
MARTQIPVDKVSDDGAVFAIDTAADDVNGMYFINYGDEVLFVENTGTASINVTVDYAPDKYGRDGSVVHSIAAGATQVVAKFRTALYNQNGSQVFVDFSASTANVAVVKPA